MSVQRLQGPQRPDPVPLSAIESAFWDAEEGSAGAFRAAVVMRLDGCIETHTLSLALERLQHRHPKLRAVVARDRDGRRSYHFDRIASPIPIEIHDYDGDDFPWREEARRQLSLEFPSPGPFVRVAAFRSRARGCSELLLVVHHAIADGRSTLMLVENLLTEYGHSELSEDGPSRPIAPPVSVPRAPRTGGWSDRLWLIRRFLRIQREERRARQTPLPAGRDVPAQSQWVRWVFTSEETVRLVRRCRRERTSFAGVMHAATCAGLMECLPVSEGVFKCQFPFDLRGILEGPEGPVTALDLGCFSSAMNEFYFVRRQPAFWELARHAQQSVDAFVRRGGPGFYYNLSAAEASRALKPLAPMLVAPRHQRPTLLATNYGVVNFAESYGQLRPRECAVGMKHDSVGPLLMMEALVMGQRLNVGFSGDGLEPVFWDRLKSAVRRHLDMAASPGDGARAKAFIAARSPFIAVAGQ